MTSADGELLRNDLRVKVRDQSFLLLAALLEQPGERVTREELRSRLWPEGHICGFRPQSECFMKRLRDDLGDDPDNPHFIETVPKWGYRFLAPVEDPSIRPTELLLQPSTPPIASSPLHLTSARRIVGYLALLGIVASVVLYVVLRRPLPGNMH